MSSKRTRAAPTPAEDASASAEEQKQQHEIGATVEPAEGAPLKKQRTDTPASASSSSSSAVSIHSLARVEVQSIMHCLQRDELAQLARCSRRMYSDANERSAWKYADSSLTINQAALAGGIGQAIRQNGLIVRHLPPAKITCGSDEKNEAVVLECVCATHPLRNIAQLSIVVYSSRSERVLPLNCQQWLDAFTLLPLSSIEQLHLRISRCSQPLLDAMASWLPMTNLRTLDLDFQWPSRSEPLSAAISQLPHLTTLSVYAGRESRERPSLMDLVGCTSLTHLSLSDFSLEGGLFQRFFTSLKSAPRLTRLDLPYLYVNSTGRSYVAAFAALSGLEHLHVSTWWDPTEFMSQAHHAPRLRLVEFEHFSLPSPGLALVSRVLRVLHPSICLLVRGNLTSLEEEAAIALDPKRVTVDGRKPS
jgi:hypothetical protein